jgi:hypothetical protein
VVPARLHAAGQPAVRDLTLPAGVYHISTHMLW